MHSLAQILSSFRFSLAHTASNCLKASSSSGFAFLLLARDSRSKLRSPLARSSVPPFPGGQKPSKTDTLLSEIIRKSDKYRANERRTKLAWVIPSAADII